MFSFDTKNDLKFQHRSGFKAGDSCTNLLLSITPEIHKSFDQVRSFFLDISKAFDKIWHDGIIFKLKQNGISNRMALSNFLTNRKSKVLK